MTVHAADENGCPLSADIKSVFLLPDGTIITDLEWTQTDPGTYNILSPRPRRGTSL